jgi:mRNA interferase MazF
MNRGDLIAVVLPGSYGEPRPALIVQNDFFHHLDSVTVVPLTSDTLEASAARVPVAPTVENGLRQPSNIMIDKIGTIPKSKVGYVIGKLARDDLTAVDRALALFLGFS